MSIKTVDLLDLTSIAQDFVNGRECRISLFGSFRLQWIEFVFVIRTMLQFYAKIIPPILCTASGQRYFYFLPKVLVNTTEMIRECINSQSLF